MMRRILVMVLTAVLLMGSFGSSMVRADGVNPVEMGEKWVKFSEKIKLNKGNKISPYFKPGVGSKYSQVIVETRVQPLYAKTNNPSPEEKQQQQAQLDQLRSEIMAISPKAKIDYIFKNIFTGFALSVPANKVKDIALISNIQSIHPVLDYKALGSPTKALGAEMVWSRKDAQGSSVTGKGIKVGIVDTGIDYNHPDLKNNYKGGYDAVRKNNDPKDGHGHGTHVAGIIAANGKMKGIAPEASIYSYRVLNNQGRGTNATIIAGIEKAVEDKVDVMNLSLGGRENSPDDPLALALNKVVEKGITVTVANGNDGGSGNWTVGTPATAERVISVGASSLPGVARTYSLTMNNPLDKSNPINIDVEYLSKTKAQPGTKWELVDIGLGGSMEDYKGKNVRGKMVLVRSSADADILIRNAEKAGAVAIISENMVMPKSYEKTNMAIFVPYAMDRDALKKAMKAGGKVFTLKQNATRSTEEIAAFSSRGMVQGSWAVKPDVVAPGVSIRSTVPKKLGKSNSYDKAYDSWDGTSMASPQVAGAAVLLKQMHPDWSPVEVKAALSNTAKDLMDPNTGKSYMVKEQGSGRIDIPRAIDTTTLITPNNLTFGLINPKPIKKEKTKKKGKKSRQGKKSKKDDDEKAIESTEADDTVQVEKAISVKNMSKTVKTYSTLVELVNGHKGTKISIPSQIKVDPNSIKSVSVKASIKRTMPRGIYTGRLFLRERNGQQYIVPFTFCINPSSYARINYLDASQEFISPLSKKAKGSTEVSYYVPNAVNYVTLYLSGDKLKPTIIHEGHDVTGWQKFQWDGTLNGKPLPDGIYTLEAVARDGSNQQDVTAATVYVYSNGPKLTSEVNQEEGTIKLQVEHELAVLSYFINSFYSLFGLSMGDWVNVQYQLQGTDKWVKLPLTKGKLKKKKNTAEDLTGKIELTIAPPYSWMKGTNDTVIIKATDKAGNQTKVEVKIPK